MRYFIRQLLKTPRSCRQPKIMQNVSTMIYLLILKQKHSKVSQHGPTVETVCFVTNSHDKWKVSSGEGGEGTRHNENKGLALSHHRHHLSPTVPTRRQLGGMPAPPTPYLLPTGTPPRLSTSSDLAYSPRPQSQAHFTQRSTGSPLSTAFRALVQYLLC